MSIEYQSNSFMSLKLYNEHLETLYSSALKEYYKFYFHSIGIPIS